MKLVAFLLESFEGQSPLQWSRGVFVNRRSPRAGGWTTPIGRWTPVGWMDEKEDVDVSPKIGVLVPPNGW